MRVVLNKRGCKHIRARNEDNVKSSPVWRMSRQCSRSLTGRNPGGRIMYQAESICISPCQPVAGLSAAHGAQLNFGGLKLKLATAVEASAQTIGGDAIAL